MLSPQERKLLCLLVLWLAAGALLDALALRRPRTLVPLVGEARLSQVLDAGRAEPAAAPAAAASASAPPPSRAPAHRRAAPRAAARARPWVYDLQGRLDLNLADAAELDLVSGIGPALAARILAERARRGRFAAVDELLAVRGIGPRTLARIRPQVTVHPAAGAADSAHAVTDSARAPATRAKARRQNAR